MEKKQFLANKELWVVTPEFYGHMYQPLPNLHDLSFQQHNYVVP